MYHSLQMVKRGYPHNTPPHTHTQTSNAKMVDWDSERGLSYSLIRNHYPGRRWKHRKDGVKQPLVSPVLTFWGVVHRHFHFPWPVAICSEVKLRLQAEY